MFAAVSLTCAANDEPARWALLNNITYCTRHTSCWAKSDVCTRRQLQSRCHATVYLCTAVHGSCKRSCKPTLLSCKHDLPRELTPGIFSLCCCTHIWRHPLLQDVILQQ